jgi:hypothetical protein
MLQTKKRRGVISHNGKALGDLHKSTMKLLKEGGTPEVVTWAAKAIEEIGNDVETAIQHSHDEDQALVTHTLARFDEIATQFTEKVVTLHELRGSHEVKSSSHLTCRAEQRIRCDAHTACVVEEERLKKIKEEALVQFQTAWGILSDVNPSESTECRNTQEHKYDMFVQSGRKYFDAWEESESKQNDCGDLHQALVEQRLRCDGLKQGYESAVCTSHDHATMSYDDMIQNWELQESQYADVRNAVGAGASDRHAEFQTLAEVKCLLAKVQERGGQPCDEEEEEGVSEKIEEQCKDEAKDTSHFIIHFPDPPHQPAKPDSEEYPCTPKFIEDSYGSLTGQCFDSLPMCKSCASAHDKTDDCSGWSVDKHVDVDGTCYMGAFDNSNQRITKSFTGLRPSCTYKWSAVIDTWASLDNEQITLTVNGQGHDFPSRGAGSCDNGWTEYPDDFGDKVGSHGSSNNGWKDCWKNFESVFVAPASGKADVDMYMAINQDITDEGWGWHNMNFQRLSCPVLGGDQEDDCNGWSVDQHADVDGKCYMGAFDNSNQRITKIFSGLSAGCTYKWSAVIDTWASVDNEQITLTVNGDATDVPSRVGSDDCNSSTNGWTEYPQDFGDKVGSHGSSWAKDCWKNFEKEFVVPADGKANVDMYMAINQDINDEGWGWHDMKFQRLSCPEGHSEPKDNCDGWSVDKHANVDGKCYMGPFDNSNSNLHITRTFSGLTANCTYKWKAVIDTWASVDNEQITLTINGDATDVPSRGFACNDENGWTKYPNLFGQKVGSLGTGNDCWKNFEKEFVVPADGKANVDMYMAINQDITDEGWGWHDMEFEKMHCK